MTAATHVIRCPACDGWGGKFENGKSVDCSVCKGQRLVAVKVQQLVVLEPFKATKEEPKS